jgi:hypothetical protein
VPLPNSSRPLSIAPSPSRSSASHGAVGQAHLLVFRPDVTAPDLPALRVDQAVGGVVVVVIADAIEVVTFAGKGVELIEIGDASAAQAVAERRAGEQRGSFTGHVHQPEAVIAGGITTAVESQRVNAGRQPQQRIGLAQLVGIRVLQVATQDVAVRTAHGPGDVAVAQAVEIEQGLVGQ